MIGEQDREPLLRRAESLVERADPALAGVDARAILARALFLRAMDDAPSATALLERAVELDPSNIEAARARDASRTGAVIALVLWGLLGVGGIGGAGAGAVLLRRSMRRRRAVAAATAARAATLAAGPPDASAPAGDGERPSRRVHATSSPFDVPPP